MRRCVVRLAHVTAAPHPAPVPPDPSLGEAVLRPVRGHHAFEACVEQLGTAIRLGVYPRGSTLPPERELAERMGVSRATLREAMAALRRGRAGTRHAADAGAARWSRSSRPSRAVGVGAPCTAARRAGAGWTRSSSGASSSRVPAQHRRRHRPVRRLAPGPGARPTRPSPAPARRRRTGRPTRASTSPSPRSPGPDADRGRHVGAGVPARHAHRDPGAADEHRPLRPAARDGSSRRCSPGTPSRARREMEQPLRRHGRAAARPAGLRERACATTGT